MTILVSRDSQPHDWEITVFSEGVLTEMEKFP